MDVSSVRPVRRRPAYDRWVREVAAATDPLFHAVIDLTTGLTAASPALWRRSSRPGPSRLDTSPTRRCFENSGRHGNDVPDDAARVPARVPSLRMEVRRARRALARGGQRLGLSFEGVFRRRA